MGMANRKTDPIYYKMKVSEWLNKAKENGVELEFKSNVYGTYLFFRDIGTTITIDLGQYAKEV